MSWLVVDASAGVEILLSTPAGSRLRQLIPPGADVAVPEIYYVEVVATLRRMELHGDLMADRASFALRRLLAVRIVRTQVKPLLDEAWTLRQNVTAADALYVVLARRLVAPLLTADQRLAGAPGLGITVVT